MKLGVQTYTIRSIANKNFELALNLLSRKGIQKIEFARLKASPRNAKIIKDHDFEVLSVQATYHKLAYKKQAMLHFCRAVECHKVVVSVLPILAILGGRHTLLRFAKKLNQLKDFYKTYDIEVGFHHHDFEFKNISGQTKFDMLLKHTDHDLKFVIDTYWAYSQNVDLKDLIDKIGHRLMGIHLRDYKRLNHKAYKDAEVGSGMIDFHEVIKHGRLYKPYLVIEQDSKSPMQSIEKSKRFLLDHFKLDIET